MNLNIKVPKEKNWILPISEIKTHRNSNKSEADQIKFPQIIKITKSGQAQIRYIPQEKSRRYRKQSNRNSLLPPILNSIELEKSPTDNSEAEMVSFKLRQKMEFATKSGHSKNPINYLTRGTKARSKLKILEKPRRIEESLDMIISPK